MTAPAASGAVAIGGVLLRARHPEAPGRRYAGHPGVPAHGPWPRAGGIAILAPCAADTDYRSADRAFLLNLRVVDLDARVSRLRAAGIAVETRPEWDSPETGRFARITDPQRNPLELWEPPPA